MDRTTLLDQIRQAHDRWEAALRAVPDDRLLEPAEGDWTGKDVVAHVGFWEWRSADVIDALRSGRERPEDPPVEELNARVWAEHRDRSAQEVRDGEREAWRRLLEVLDGVSDEELFDAARYPRLRGASLAEMVLEDTSRHYPEHIAQLAAAGRGSAGG